WGAARAHRAQRAAEQPGGTQPGRGRVPPDGPALPHRTRAGGDHGGPAGRGHSAPGTPGRPVLRQLLRHRSDPPLRRGGRPAHRVHRGTRGPGRTGRMTAFEAMMNAAYAAEHLDRWYGVYPALVDDVRDPDGQGRVQVRLPWAVDSGGAAYLAWAR